MRTGTDSEDNVLRSLCKCTVLVHDMQLLTVPNAMACLLTVINV